MNRQMAWQPHQLIHPQYTKESLRKAPSKFREINSNRCTEVRYTVIHTTIYTTIERKPNHNLLSFQYSNTTTTMNQSTLRF